MGRAKSKVGVSSIAVDPLRPHLFITGGGDALGALRLDPSCCVSPVIDLEARARGSSDLQCP